MWFKSICATKNSEHTNFVVDNRESVLESDFYSDQAQKASCTRRIAFLLVLTSLWTSISTFLLWFCTWLCHGFAYICVYLSLLLHIYTRACIHIHTHSNVFDMRSRGGVARTKCRSLVGRGRGRLLISDKDLAHTHAHTFSNNNG